VIEVGNPVNALNHSPSFRPQSPVIGGGKMGDLIRVFDWENTAIGPMANWSQTLITTVNIMLNSPVPLILLWGTEGIMLYNDAYAVLAGARHPQILGAKVLEGWPEVANFNRNVMEIVLKGKALSYQDQKLTLHRHNMPEEVWLDINYSPVMDESGQPAGVLAIVEETTRRVRAEQELRESEARFRIISNAAPNFVWTLGPDGEQTYINEYGLKFLGVSLEEILKNSWAPYLHPNDVEPARQALSKAIETRTIYRLEHRIRRADGEYRWVLSSANPSFLPNGELYAYVGSSIDITDRKHAEEELLSYARQLERSNQELEQFATIASHDLSEPLRKIQAFTGILEDHVLDEGKDYLKRMNSAASRMRLLMDDLLTLSRVNRKGQPFKAINLNEALKTVLDDMQITLLQTNASVRIEPLEAVQGDESQVRQLLQNIIGNAIKYHRDGVEPVVTISGKPVGDFYEVTIADNAIGIKEDYFERIFEPFQRLHGIDKYPGTGMGLAICRKIVERHGGTIQVQSVPGEGSQFSFTLKSAGNP